MDYCVRLLKEIEIERKRIDFERTATQLENGANEFAHEEAMFTFLEWPETTKALSRMRQSVKGPGWVHAMRMLLLTGRCVAVQKISEKFESYDARCRARETAIKAYERK